VFHCHPLFLAAPAKFGPLGSSDQRMVKLSAYADVLQGIFPVYSQIQCIGGACMYVVFLIVKGTNLAGFWSHIFFMFKILHPQQEAEKKILKARPIFGLGAPPTPQTPLPIPLPRQKGYQSAPFSNRHPSAYSSLKCCRVVGQ